MLLGLTCPPSPIVMFFWGVRTFSFLFLLDSALGWGTLWLPSCSHIQTSLHKAEMRCSTAGPLAISITGVPVVPSPAVTVCVLLPRERLEVSTDILEVPSEDKNMFAALATNLIRPSEDLSEGPYLAGMNLLPPGFMRAYPAVLCLSVLSMLGFFLHPKHCKKSFPTYSRDHVKSLDADLILISFSMKLHRLGREAGKISDIKKQMRSERAAPLLSVAEQLTSL